MTINYQSIYALVSFFSSSKKQINATFGDGWGDGAGSGYGFRAGHGIGNIYSVGEGSCNGCGDGCGDVGRCGIGDEDGSGFGDGYGQHSGKLAFFGGYDWSFLCGIRNEI